jgi:flavin-dependent dehydrogenase
MLAHPTSTLICIGGGLAGSVLAKVMAERGYRVLVLERTSHFQDRRPWRGLSFPQPVKPRFLE